MRKAKAIRVAGFVGALCASAALVGTSVAGTGAYFTDSHNGNLAASSGHLRLNVDGSALNLSFQNLVPGEYQTKNVTYATDTNTNEDIWMVFDTSSAAYGAFSGGKGMTAYPDGGLGRYGHFAVANDNATRFTSYNLANQPAGDTSTTDTCGVNSSGNGGSNDVATPTHTPLYCGVPGAILLRSDAPNGASGEIEVTFGVTPKWTAQEVPVANVPFKIVATQHGVRPDNAYNPAP